MSEAPRQTPLYDRHRAAGARMVPFAGFSMPVLYTSIVAEHNAVRSAAGLFDVSHMGELRICGRDALALTQKIFTNQIKYTEKRRVKYGFICQDDGGIIDDITAFPLGPEEVLLCVNAVNTGTDADWARSVQSREGLVCEIIDETLETGLLALQGPLAAELLALLSPDGTPLPRPWRFEPTALARIPTLLSRTGYTGEDGFEIFVAADQVAALWDALMRAAGNRLALCGLGARDTLRTEMAYPLYGQDLDRSRSPIEAGLGRFCAFGNGFIGEEALLRLQEADPAERRVGVRLEIRAVARPGCPILAQERVGVVTSGTYGPSVERSIAMGYVPAQYADVGTQLAVEIRGRRVPCEVVKTPFYDRKT